MRLEYNAELINTTKQDLEKCKKKLKDSILEIDKIIKSLEHYFLENGIETYEDFFNTYNKKRYNLLDCLKLIEEYQTILENKKNSLNKISKNTLNRFD